jgi:hypothetical protein
VKEKLSLPFVGENVAGDNRMDSNFIDSKPDFDVMCNVKNKL